MSVPTQDYSAVITWTQDWSNHLTTNGGLTITSATATCVDDRVTVDDATVTDAGTSVTFRVSQAGIIKYTVVTVAVQVALSNGDTDERSLDIAFTNT